MTHSLSQITHEVEPPEQVGSAESTVAPTPPQPPTTTHPPPLLAARTTATYLLHSGKVWDVAVAGAAPTITSTPPAAVAIPSASRRKVFETSLPVYVVMRLGESEATSSVVYRFVCVTSPLHLRMCHITPSSSYVSHHPFIFVCVTSPLHQCDQTHPCVRHEVMLGR